MTDPVTPKPLQLPGPGRYACPQAEAFVGVFPPYGGFPHRLRFRMSATQELEIPLSLDVLADLATEATGNVVRPPPPLTWLERDTAYLCPSAVRHEAAAVPSDKGPIRIRLRLDDGNLLAIPLTQGAIDGLVGFLTPLATPPEVG